MEENRVEKTEMAEEDRTSETSVMEEKKRTESMKSHRERGEASRFRLTGSLVAKVAAFLLMLVSAAVCAVCVVGCYGVYEGEMYSSSYTTILKSGLNGEAHSIASRMYNFLNNDYGVSARLYLKDTNAEVAIMRFADQLAPDSSVFIWQSYEESEAPTQNGFYSELYDDIYMSMPEYAKFVQQVAEESGAPKETDYIVRVFFDPEFAKDDDIRATAHLIEAIYRMRYAMIWFCAGGALLFAICVIFLLCSAGHKNGREGIVPGLLTGIPFDILTGGVVSAVAVLLELVIRELSYPEMLYIIGQIAICIIVLILGMTYLYDFAIRLKLGKLWRHTFTFAVLRLLWRGLRLLWRGFRKLWRGFCRMLAEVPMALITVIVYWVVCIVELLIIASLCRIYNEDFFLFLWGTGKMAVFVAVFYVALTFRRLLKASRELAEGHEDYRVDTKHMFWVFREQGENLNRLGQGVARAVSERMKSERLKTELITNVSHDLKTPLTSIINYAELISREAEENPAESQAIREYSEVLLRQSGRLKRLLENLVEASKAATGNLEVNLESCEAGVLLSQAVGEYQKRLEEKALELRVSQPEEPVRILADGRHLWRVFDNLLNNICKYAQENSRVYLTLEQKEKKALIIFRNMSKYALDISPEELEERFVRGDKSRHMEGNGLGLSIAKSLTELQKGQMEIVVDGDLFKVILTFDAMD